MIRLKLVLIEAYCLYDVYKTLKGQSIYYVKLFFKSLSRSEVAFVFSIFYSMHYLVDLSLKYWQSSIFPHEMNLSLHR